MQRYMSPGTLLQLHRTTTSTTTTATATTNTSTTATTTKPSIKMNFINKGIMTGRAKLSKIIHVKPFQLTDEKNKENLDISKPKQRESPDATLDSKLPSSLTNSIEDVYAGSPRPSQRKPTPTSSSNRRSRSLDRLTTSGTSSDRRNSYFDIRNHTHSLGSQQELAPVFTTTYRTVFSTLTTNTPTTANVNGTNSYTSSKNSLSNGSIGSRFKTAEFTFQKSPVKRRAKW